jgi:hypothetical protein
MKERERLKKKTMSNAFDTLIQHDEIEYLVKKHCVQKVQSITRCNPQPWA